MCHASVPSVGKRALMAQRRWLILQATLMAATRRTAVAVARETGEVGSTKQCLCSPTKHPGSFRCRHHHAEYVWGGRFVAKKIAPSIAISGIGKTDQKSTS